jgi:hypothetical protein
MKKLLLLCLFFISFKTLFAVSVVVTAVPKITPNCNDGGLNVHVNYDIITNAFRVRITGPGGYVYDACPVGLIQNFDVDVFNLASGTYTVEVWRLGFLAPCSGPYDFYTASSINITSPPNYTATINHTNTTAPGTYGCASGSLNITTNCMHSLTANVYLNGNFLNSYILNGILNVNNLAAGNYSVELTHPCYNTVTLTEIISSTPCNTQFNPTVTPSDQGCNNGSISLTILNGIDVDYDDITVSSIPSGNLIQTHLHNPNVNHTFNNLAPGSYWVTVFEHRLGGIQCYCASPSMVVTITENVIAPPTVVTINPTSSPTCNDGSVTMSNNDVYNNLPAGLNTLNGTYQSGCSSPGYTESVIIPANPCITITSFQSVLSSAINCNTGVIHLELSASATYLFKLYRNGTEILNLNYIGSSYYFQNLASGNYEIQVFNLDQCSCSISATTTLSAVTCSIAGTLNTMGTCYAQFTGYIENACPPYSVQIFKGNNQSFVDSISPGFVFDYPLDKNGKYTFKLTDATGCTSSTQVYVNNISCNAPANLSFATLPDNKVKLMWDAEFCAVGYTIQYRLVNAANWTNIQMNINKDNKVITNIQQNMQYEWHIRTKCTATTKSAYSAIENFCSGPNCTARLLTELKNTTENIELKVIPNPATDFIKISVNSENEISGVLTICNELGKKIYAADSATINDNFIINTSNFPSGLYIINFVTGSKNYASRFIKAN